MPTPRRCSANCSNTRKALEGFEPALKLPESREFYWSKIKREIQRLEPVQAPAKSASIFSLLRRVLLPLGSVAVLAIVGVLAYQQFGGYQGGTPHAQVSAMLADVRRHYPLSRPGAGHDRESAFVSRRKKVGG